MKILVLCHTSEVEDVKKVFPPGKFDVHNLDYQPADAQVAFVLVSEKMFADQTTTDRLNQLNKLNWVRFITNDSAKLEKILVGVYYLTDLNFYLPDSTFFQRALAWLSD